MNWSNINGYFAAIAKRRKGLTAQLKVQNLAEDELQSMLDFATEVAEGLAKADEDFETMRYLLTIEDGKRIICPRCHF